MKEAEVKGEVVTFGSEVPIVPYTFGAFVAITDMISQSNCGLRSLWQERGKGPIVDGLSLVTRETAVFICTIYAI